jgi:hypothetical protein
MKRLGLMPPYTKEDVHKAYKENAKTVHPDHGGDPVSFNRLRDAHDRAMEYVEFRASRRDWLSAQVEHYTQYLDFVGDLESRGCTLIVEAEDWRQRSWGDFAQVTERILAVHANGPKFNDELAEYLHSNRQFLGSIRLIDISESELTDAGMQRLASLSELIRIDIRNTSVSAEGVRQLCQGLQRIEAVHIGGTSINWLRRLKLRRSFPDIEFIIDMNISLDSSPRTRFSHLAEMTLG